MLLTNFAAALHGLPLGLGFPHTRGLYLSEADGRKERRYEFTLIQVVLNTMSPSTLQVSPPSRPIDVPPRQRPSSIADDYGTGPEKSKSGALTPQGKLWHCGSNNASSEVYRDTGAGFEDDELSFHDDESTRPKEAPLPPKPPIILEKQQIDEAREKQRTEALRRFKGVAKTPNLESIKEIVRENTAGDCPR